MPSTPFMLNFPISLDDTVSLGEAKDRASGALGSDLTSDATSLILSSTTDAAEFPNSGPLVIEEEDIYYTSRIGVTFSGLLRGRNGSTAASHLAGTAVDHSIVSSYHTVVSLCLQAIETKLGIGNSSPTLDKFLIGDGSGSSAWQSPVLSATAIGDGSVSNAEFQFLDGVTSSIQTQLDAKSPLASPTFTGVPAAPTAAAATNTTQIATTAFVRTELSNLIASAPSTLDTLNELATALGNDPNFATTITTSIATKGTANSTPGTVPYLSATGVFSDSPITRIGPTTIQVTAINGGASANDDITIQGTSNATRTTSYVLLQPSGGLVGVGLTAPVHSLHVVGNIQLGSLTNADGSTGGTLVFNAGGDTAEIGGNIDFNGAGGSLMARIRKDGGNFSNNAIVFRFLQQDNSTYRDNFYLDNTGLLRGGTSNGATNGSLVFYKTSAAAEVDNIVVGNMSTSAGSNSSIRFESYSTGSYRAKIVAEAPLSTDISGNLNFYTNNGTSLLSGMVLTFAGKLGIGTTVPNSIFSALLSDSTTNSLTTVITIDHRGGTVADGFGSSELWRLESSTTNDQSAFQLDVLWATATDASRKARVTHSVYDTAARECVRMEASGSAAMIGFLGASAVTKRTDSGGITDNTGGSIDGTLVDVGVVFNQTNTNNNFADLAAKYNAIRTALRDLGLMA